MIKRFSLSFFLFFISVPFLFSQYQKLTEFSVNRTEYLKQLEEMMTASKRDVLEEVFNSYQKKFLSGLFTDEEFAQILRTSNAMLEQKMGASPYFSFYLEGLSVVKNGEKGDDQFKTWHMVLDTMLAGIENRRLNPYKDFLSFSINFFLDNSLRYSKSGTTWQVKTKDFNLAFEKGVPVLDFEQVNLVASRKQDSIVIMETSGRFFPLESLWKGKGGKVSWDRHENHEDVYCILGDYSIDITKGLYEVTEAELNYPELFPNGPVKGKLEDKLFVSNLKNGGSYPRFESKDSVLNISNIGAGIQFKGGFRLHGTTVYGFGSKYHKARMIMYRKSTTPVFKLAGELFTIKKGERIIGERIETVLFFDQDSIYHPSVNLNFDIAGNVMKINRGDRGSDRNPFYNSFNNMNIDTDRIDWFIERDSMIIGSVIPGGFGKGNKKVVFESLEYFDEGDYRRIQNIANYNPIATLKVISEKEGTNFLGAERLAKLMNPRFSVSSIQSLLYDLVAQGFVNYDNEKQVVEVKDKVRHYANASMEKVDYDVLRIVSETEKANAVFNSKTKETITDGVRSIEFSQKQKVAMKPFNSQVVIKKNRDMLFDGKLYAGFALFQGKDFKFEYDKFQINMDSIRFFDLFVPSGEKDEQDQPIAYSIGSRIEHLSGILLIDAPSNKSGKENIPLFPSFQSRGPAYVFYDDKNTLDGVYQRDSFYFELDEFGFNSLDSFQVSDVKYKGSMVSFDIFPDFKETLLLREEDQSLGFVSNTPDVGYPIYVGKGNYKGEISLSNAGFLGKGNLNYLGASIDSEDIIFRPKQLTGSADMFHLDEDRTNAVEVPEVDGYDVSIDWRPYKDSMYVRTKEKPFELFAAKAHTLEGTMILTPGGLKGRGSFNWDKGRIASQLFNFGAFSLEADTSNLQIKSLATDALAFDTKDVWSSVDFDKMKGRFKSNSAEGVTAMPYNQYTTSLDEFEWDMKDETVTFLSGEGKTGLFTSIHPDQDSLQFEGKTGFYDLKTGILQIGEVPKVFSVDAYIFPDLGKVEVKPGGIMSTLENAKIVASTENENHVINKATVDIRGKRYYKASGYYEYNIGPRQQEILFADIIGQPYGKGKPKEKPVRTQATGEIKAEDNFYIDHKTMFHGQIVLKADSKNLEFDGFAKFDAPKMVGADWFSISSKADKKNLLINFDEPKNYNGDPIRAGLYLSKERALIYPRTMMPLYFRKDRAIMDARGVFRYDPKSDQFLFGDSTRVATGSFRGNLLTYDNKDAGVRAEGKFNLGDGLGKVSITAAGRMDASFDPEKNNKTTAELMAGITMAIPEKLVRVMLTDIKSSTFDANPIDYLKKIDKFNETALAQLIPDDKALESTIEDMKAGGFRLPKKYDPYTFFFSDLPMIWDADYQSFVSSENRVGLASIAGEPINSSLICFVEFKMPSNNDDRLYIYLKSPSDYFYFFGYQKGILSISSNNLRFTELMEGMKKKELVVKGLDGEDMEIQLVDIATAERFSRRAQAVRK